MSSDAHTTGGRNCRSRYGKLRWLWRDQHGIYAVAHPLRLDYVGLKKRLVGASHTAPKAVRASNLKTAFVELPAPSVALIEEGMLEFESARGDKMRIPLRATENRDWTKLLRAWRETEG